MENKYTERLLNEWKQHGKIIISVDYDDTLGFAAKGAWFEVEEIVDLGRHGSTVVKKSYNIYKDPVTDDGSKRSLRGLLSVVERYTENPDGITKSEYFVQTECTPEEEDQGLLQVIYEDGKFYNITTFNEIRNRLKGQ